MENMVAMEVKYVHYFMFYLHYIKQTLFLQMNLNSVLKSCVCTIFILPAPGKCGTEMWQKEINVHETRKCSDRDCDC